MKRRRIVLAWVLLLAVFCGGCSRSDAAADSGNEVDPEDSSAVSQEADDGTEAEDSGETDQTELTGTDEEMFTDRDYDTEYQEEDSVLIQLNGDSAEATSDSVQISGSTVTITEEATYVISGTLEDGMIIVDVPDTAKPQLVFNGVSVNSAQSAALYILGGDKVFVTLAEGTENTLSNGGTFTAIDDNNIDGVVFSKQDLTFNGSGSLTVTSPAGHGIVCKDDLVITGGTYTVTASSQGLDANDSIRITGETDMTIQAGKDGLHAENDEDASLGFVYLSGGNFNIQADGDGISSNSTLQIQEGSFQIVAGGGSENGTKSSYDSMENFRGGGKAGKPGAAGQPNQPEQNQAMEMAEITAVEEESSTSTSMKGIKAVGALLISNGDFTIDSADDGIHSNGQITIDGGSFQIATGDDAFHADETLTVNGGTVNVTESYEGLEALHLVIQGGDLTIVSSDDGLNAAGGNDASGTTGGRDGMFGGGGKSFSSDGTIVISGGTLYVNASGDGIDANGSVEMTGGAVTVVGPTQGDTTTLDYDTTATITGGTFWGTGAAGMAQTFTDSQQGVLSVNVGNQSAGTTVSICDSQGNTVADFAPELSFQVVIFSDPQLVSGETYTITVGTVSQEIEAQ